MPARLLGFALVEVSRTRTPYPPSHCLLASALARFSNIEKCGNYSGALVGNDLPGSLSCQYY